MKNAKVQQVITRIRGTFDGFTRGQKAVTIIAVVVAVVGGVADADVQGLALGRADEHGVEALARAQHSDLIEFERFGPGRGRQVQQMRGGQGHSPGRVELLQVSLQDLGSRRAVVSSLGGQAELLPGRLTLAALLYNLTQSRLADYQDERVPTVLRAGLLYRPSRQVLLLAEAEKDVEQAAGLRAGIEYQPAAAVAVRLGYASGSGQATVGAGIHLGTFHFDYAAGWHAALGLSQCMSVHWQWARAEPAQPADE